MWFRGWYGAGTSKGVTCIINLNHHHHHRHHQHHPQQHHRAVVSVPGFLPFQASCVQSQLKSLQRLVGQEEK